MVIVAAAIAAAAECERALLLCERRSRSRQVKAVAAWRRRVHSIGHGSAIAYQAQHVPERNERAEMIDACCGELRCETRAPWLPYWSLDLLSRATTCV